jgi:hypothetical protein
MQMAHDRKGGLRDSLGSVLRHLLLGRKFLLRTDHANLVFIDSGTSDKVRRWKLDLQEYDFDVEHVQDNIIADPLSRLCASRIDELEAEIGKPASLGVYFLGRNSRDATSVSLEESSESVSLWVLRERAKNRSEQGFHLKHLYGCSTGYQGPQFQRHPLSITRRKLHTFIIIGSVIMVLNRPSIDCVDIWTV